MEKSKNTTRRTAGDTKENREQGFPGALVSDQITALGKAISAQLMHDGTIYALAKAISEIPIEHIQPVVPQLPPELVDKIMSPSYHLIDASQGLSSLISGDFSKMARAITTAYDVGGSLSSSILGSIDMASFASFDYSTLHTNMSLLETETKKNVEKDDSVPDSFRAKEELSSKEIQEEPYLAKEYNPSTRQESCLVRSLPVRKKVTNSCLQKRLPQTSLDALSPGERAIRGDMKSYHEAQEAWNRESERRRKHDKSLGVFLCFIGIIVPHIVKAVMELNGIDLPFEHIAALVEPSIGALHSFVESGGTSTRYLTPRLRSPSVHKEAAGYGVHQLGRLRGRSLQSGHKSARYRVCCHHGSRGFQQLRES